MDDAQRAVISKLLGRGPNLRDIFDEAYNDVIYRGGPSEDFAMPKAEREELFQLFYETVHKCQGSVHATILTSALSKLIHAHLSAVSKITDLSKEELSELTEVIMRLKGKEK